MQEMSYGVELIKEVSKGEEESRGGSRNQMTLSLGLLVGISCQKSWYVG